MACCSVRESLGSLVYALQKKFDISNMGKSALRSHAKGRKKHSRLAEVSVVQVNQFFVPSSAVSRASEDSSSAREHIPHHRPQVLRHQTKFPLHQSLVCELHQVRWTRMLRETMVFRLKCCGWWKQSRPTIPSVPALMLLNYSSACFLIVRLPGSLLCLY